MNLSLKKMPFLLLSKKEGEGERGRERERELRYCVTVNRCLEGGC